MINGCPKKKYIQVSGQLPKAQFDKLNLLKVDLSLNTYGYNNYVNFKNSEAVTYFN